MNTLGQIPFLHDLDIPIGERLLETGTILECQPDEVLYHYEDKLSGMYALVSGHVKLYRESGSRIQILALLRQGDCFGTEALSEPTNSSYTAATLTEAQILFLPKETLRQLMIEHPQVRIAILQLATDRLRQFASLVHNLAFRDVMARLATIILMRADMDGTKQADGIHVPRLMTQSEIATMVGTGREVVLRTFKKLEKQQIIQVSRKEIIITNIDKLREIAEEENR